MNPPSRKRALLTVVGACLLTIPFRSAAARDKTADVRERFEDVSGVVSIEVPVNVVGKDGQSVRNLTKADFEVTDDGRPQTITSFEVVDLSLLAPAAAPESKARAEQLEAPGRRHFLLLFDLTFSSVAATLKARTAAREFVLTSLAPTDLAAVATISLENGPRLVATFTTDRSQLARAIDTLGSRNVLATERVDPLRFVLEPPTADASGPGGTDQSRLPDLRDDRLGGALGDYLATISVMGAKDERLFDTGRVVAFSRALAATAQSLKSLKGRKHVIFFSEGFDSRLMLGREASRIEEQQQEANDLSTGRLWMTDLDNRYGNTELQNEIGRMAEAFRKADCVIQAVDIGGLRTADESRKGSGKEALFFMANETGGELYEDANNLTQHLKKLLDRTAVTYLLGFERSDLKEDGAYHRLRVRVADLPSGARVSHRAGYYAPRPFRDLDPLEKNLLAGEGIASATPRRDIDLEVLASPFRAGERLAYVPVIVEVGGDRLLEGQTGDSLAVELYAYVSDEQGQMRDYFTQQVALGLGANREALKRTGIKYYGHLELPPGRYRLRILARNTETGRTGVESLPLDVPDYSSNAPELLPPFFAEAPGSWLMVRERGGPEAKSVVYPFTVKGEPYVPAARPRLRSTGSFLVYLVAYNLSPGDLSVRGQVLDPEGRQVGGSRFDLVERTATGIAGLDKLVASFNPQGLTAGRYLLEVAVSDPTGTTRTQTLPFVVD